MRGHVRVRRFAKLVGEALCETFHSGLGSIVRSISTIFVGEGENDESEGR